MSVARWLCPVSIFLISLPALYGAQPTHAVHGNVKDPSGLPTAHAAISVGGAVATYTDAAGNFTLPSIAAGQSIFVKFQGLAAAIQAGSETEVEIVLHAAVTEQSATVTTTRSSISLDSSANTTATIDSAALTQYPALTLDERLRQQAGFELFRRSSSWVANPTSEGVSLRGLGSTAASRTLVLSDLVPLNDGFGGWIHWNEMPPETIDAVTLASGGGSDLYGSSALGGVIDVIPARPGPVLGEADLSGASEDTTQFSARTDAKQLRWSELLAGQSFRTAGYTVVAPALRGPVDVPSNVHYQTGRIEIDRTLPKDGRAWLTGNLLNEAHGNGTPLQTNGTRLWRYIAGEDWTATPRINGRVRGFGSDEAYRQSFSSIIAPRATERLTRLQDVNTQEFGASTDTSIHFAHIAFVAGGDLRDLRATDVETPYSAGAPSGLQDTTARQRFLGGFGEALAERAGWSGAASLRVDSARNLAAETITQTGASAATSAPVPDRSETVLSPRLGLAKRLPGYVTVHASAFRAFRTPTMNELYRTGQVGQQTTLANSTLLSERATGTEAGADWSTAKGFAALQATYFWTEIDRPVSAVLVSSTATAITNRRENLGQIQSQGAQLAAQIHPGPELSLNFGYQYAHAVVTAFSPQPQMQLVGLWIPEVPRHTATAQLRYQRGPGSYTLAARQSGRAFDDSSNVYELHSFFVSDAYADYRVHAHVNLYVSMQNLLNRSIETARTPTLTLGTPFVAQGGVRFDWKRD